MSIVESGSPVSNGSSSPLSPDPLLDSTPLTLDFDPMSFQFKEFNSPTEEEPPLSPAEHERQISSVTLFDPFATISPDESDIAFEPITNEKESHFNPLTNVVSDEPDLLTEPFGITSEGLIPERLQNGGEVKVDLSKNAQSCVVHETLEPDILVNQTVCNTHNPDLVLIDSQESKDTVTNDVSTSDLVACATVTTNNTDNKPSVLECTSRVESVFVQEDDSHADDFAVVNVLEHASVIDTKAKDGAFLIEDGSSDSECDSNSYKKVSSLNKNTSSMSSESSISESDSLGRSTSKHTVVRQSTVEKRVVITSSKQETTHKELSSLLTNGMESKDNFRNSPHEVESSHDEEVQPPVECPMSFKNLDASDVVGDLNEMSELLKEEIVGVDLSSLRTQYVQQIEQDPLSSAHKEVVSTGIDLQVLKTSYSQVTTEDSTQSSKEQITTGVNIRSLKQSLTHVSEETVKSAETESFETGISVNTLKTSFNKAQDEIESFSSAPVEDVIPSVDRAQVARKFSQDPYPPHASRDDGVARGSEDGKCLCRICNKHVYQMEKVTAEKCVFHKDCFKCKECGKKLTLDTYSSHEKEIYCKPHFKQLFQPKCQFGEDDITPNEKSELDYEEGKQKANELVICENTPIDLPPDVVRCETKSNDLESLSSLNLLNLKSRFELHQDEPLFPNTSVSTLQRSPSLMARMAKYQSAVTGDHTNGDLSAGEDEADRDNTVALQEAKQSLMQNEGDMPSREVKTLSLKERFEKGSVERDTELEAERLERIKREKQDDLSCFGESATSEGARSLFKQMDAAASSGSPRSPLLPLSPMKTSSSVFHHQQQGPVVVADVVKCSQPSEKEEIQVEAMQVSEKFRFFESFQDPQKERKRFQAPRDAVKEATQDFEYPRDPNVIRSSDAPEDELPATDTAKKMLNKFKALESQAENPVPVPVSAKTAKRIPQPKETELRAISPEIGRQQDPDIVRCSYKAEEDTSMVEADTAKSLRAKFENWTTDVVRENLKNEKQLDTGNGGEEECLPQADMTKTLRAMFESIKESDSLKGSTEKAKPKVSKFI